MHARPSDGEPRAAGRASARAAGGAGTKLFRALVALTLVATAVPGWAAPKHEADYFDVASMYNFARCVVNRTRPGAEKLLAADFREEDYAKSMMRLAKGHEPCLGAEMKMSGVLFAGSLAEVMLTKDLSQDELAAALHAPNPPLAVRSAEEFTGLCMAIEHPRETSELLYSDPTSEKSDALLRQYAQMLPQCVRQGQELHINTLGLRAVSALAAYRIAAANGVEGKGR